MKNDLDTWAREALARISASAAELMVQHDDWSVAMCWQAAMFEEALLYGVPGYSSPVGILGTSPIQRLRQDS